jgi:hypothetical protein
MRIFAVGMLLSPHNENEEPSNFVVPGSPVLYNINN